MHRIFTTCTIALKPNLILEFIFDMENYTYSLQKYTGRDSRHTCPRCGKPHCFTFYVDANNQPLAEDVGRCEHLTKCGYEKTPKEYFAEHPQEKPEFSKKPQPKKEEEPRKTDYVPFVLIQKSESTNNNLMRYLSKYFPFDMLEKATATYHLGSTRNGEIIFPQIDTLCMCRTGKIMAYDRNGHRIRRDIDVIDWVHNRLKKKQGMKVFNLKQCLFGEHLLTKRPTDIVCLTEGEKSAVIASMVFPQFVWISCGGKTGLTPERCKALACRDVIVYADADATEEWNERIKKLTFCKTIKLSDWAKDEPIGSKRDIADIIMEERQPIEKPTTIGDICRWMKEVGVNRQQVTFNI